MYTALIEHGEIRVLFDHRGSNHAGIFDVDVNRLRQIGVELERNLLQVEDDVCGVLHHAGNRRELVQHALDLHGGDGRALDRAEQRAAQSVAHRGAPAALERLRVEFPELIGQRLEIGRQTLRFLKTFPHLHDPSSPGMPEKQNNSENRTPSYLEYSSTMSCSLNAGV